jgi:hypothetical protein
MSTGLYTVRYESKQEEHESVMVKQVIDKMTHVLDLWGLSNQR